MAVRLVALDIDGTLLPRGAGASAAPSPEVRSAVRDLVSAGVTVILASGRMYPGTIRIAHHLGLTTPLICQQGCAVHLSDGEVLHLFRIDPHVALEIADWAREAGLPYEWFDHSRYVVSRPNPDSAEYARLSGVRAEYHPRPERLGFAPTGVGVISDRATAPEVHRTIAAHHGEALHLLDFPTVTVAVAPEANKGHALALLAEDLGVRREEVVAIGDSVNDAPMLAWAGLGVAIAHGDRYARDAADLILEEGEERLVAFLRALR